MTGIAYAREQTLTPDDYIAVVGSTYMRDRRPLANPARLAEILAGSNVIVTAREAGGEIVGLARGMTDGAWVCYLADLAVREDRQRRGIGSGLMAECRRSLGPRIGIVLLAYPEAVDYYRRLGMGEMAAFYFDREDRS